MECTIVLSDGKEFYGEVFGDVKSVEGNLSFHFGVSGYQEAISNPVNDQSVLVFSYPLIGNAGINIDDNESLNARVKSIIVNEAADIDSNWRSIMNLDDFCKSRRIVGVKGVDTRALIRYVNKHEIKSAKVVVVGYDFVEFKNDNRARTRYQTYGKGPRITLLDLGVPQSVLKELTIRNMHVSVLPFDSSVETILGTYPDGLIVSQSQKIEEHVVNVLKNLHGKLPILGLGMGAVNLAKSYGVEIIDEYHYGGFHGVKDEVRGTVIMSVQNHDKGVDKESLLGNDFNITYTEISDGGVEGFRHRFMPSVGIMFDAQGSAGSRDGLGVFDEFCELVRSQKEQSI